MTFNLMAQTIKCWRIYPKYQSLKWIGGSQLFKLQSHLPGNNELMLWRTFVLKTSDILSISSILMKNKNKKTRDYKPILHGQPIMLMSHKHQEISNNWQISCLFYSLFRVITKETSMLHIAGPLWGESTDNQWIPLIYQWVSARKM